MNPPCWTTISSKRRPPQYNILPIPPPCPPPPSLGAAFFWNDDFIVLWVSALCLCRSPTCLRFPPVGGGGSFFWGGGGVDKEEGRNAVIRSLATQPMVIDDGLHHGPDQARCSFFIRFQDLSCSYGRLRFPPKKLIIFETPLANIFCIPCVSRRAPRLHAPRCPTLPVPPPRPTPAPRPPNDRLLALRQSQYRRPCDPRRPFNQYPPVYGGLTTWNAIFWLLRRTAPKGPTTRVMFWGLPQRKVFDPLCLPPPTGGGVTVLKTQHEAWLRLR